MSLQAEGPRALHQALQGAVLGQDRALARLVLAAVAGGHVLLEDLPGVGKTTAVKALARACGADFRRVQFTPDLLPSDLTGFEIYRPEAGAFEYRPGPVFCQILLADELNRASPKVQSALLEVMEERQVTFGGQTRAVDPFFLVAATQNPLDRDGTYPLPAAQLDRFFLRTAFGYPEATVEAQVWLSGGANRDLPSPVVSTADLLALRPRAASVHVAAEVIALVTDLFARLRRDPAVTLGPSPRAGAHLVHGLRTWALLHGRDFVSPQDLVDLAVDVLAHRLVLAHPDASSADLVRRRVHEVVERSGA